MGQSAFAYFCDRILRVYAGCVFGQCVPVYSKADKEKGLEDKKIEHWGKISDLEQELNPEFFRIHKGYLVNLKQIEGYDRTEVCMKNGNKLLISKYKYQDFVKAYLQYISEES